MKNRLVSTARAAALASPLCLPQALVPGGPAARAGAAAVLAGNEPGFELDRCRCAEQLGEGQLACVAGFVACRHACRETLFAALEACARDGGPDPECIAALNAFIACHVSCFVNLLACLDNVLSRFNQCQDECPGNALVSDHGN